MVESKCHCAVAVARSRCRYPQEEVGEEEDSENPNATDTRTFEFTARVALVPRVHALCVDSQGDSIVCTLVTATALSQWRAPSPKGDSIVVDVSGSLAHA